MTVRAMTRPVGSLAGWHYRRRLQLWGHYVLLGGLGIVFLFPFFWLVSTSLKTNKEIFLWPPTLLPRAPRWANYVDAVQAFPFMLYLGNTLYITVMNVVAVTLSSSVVAYGFSKIQWPGRDAVFVLVLATMMLPYQVTMVPLFVLFKTLGWVGTFRPLVVPHFFAGAFYVFLLRQFYMTIPNELSEAAVVDGANHLRIFSSIVVPLTRPALATVALFQFVASWTDFLGPLIYLQNERQYTLQLGLQMFFGQHYSEWALVMATAALISLPLIVVFGLTQRTFVEGIALTGLRG
ncbi:carbohydrate ABC transporter permease [Carboxydochorda subterranea]|uniref:Carbohydrate ABC transporter permease n=1 Tax=Carboxydichorda subterranea TaxID=3109565 RepID=A0ABZ1BUR9_9FIRM|nr:carbohydrate ABC transporter permease [Limnochorda sp. L945t]WRP16555.1 carbohydrate ABC transporter permease [Limnochorda sp. L945t]